MKKIVDSTKNEALLEGFTRYKSQSKALAALFKFVTDFKNGALKFKNIGEIKSMNFMLSKVKTEWFSWLADDDILHPQFISKFID